MEKVRLEDGRFAEVFTVIRETWLSRKPFHYGALVGAVAVFVMALGSVVAWQNFGGAGDWMPASAAKVFNDHQYWRAWTTLLVHGDPGHFLSNSLLMFVLGSLLTGYFGLFVFPVSAFALGGVVNLFVLKTYDPDMHLIGASGVVFLMGGVWLTLYLFLERRKSLWARALRAMGVALLLFMPSEAFDPAVSYRTHAVGFVVGVAFATAYFFAKKRQFRAAEAAELVVDHIEGEESAFGEEWRPLVTLEARPAASSDELSKMRDVLGRCGQSCG